MCAQQRFLRTSYAAWKVHPTSAAMSLMNISERLSSRILRTFSSVKTAFPWDSPRLRFSGYLWDAFCSPVAALFLATISFILSACVPAQRCAGFIQARTSHVWQISTSDFSSFPESKKASRCAVHWRLRMQKAPYPFLLIPAFQMRHPKPSGCALLQNLASSSAEMLTVSRVSITQSAVAFMVDSCLLLERALRLERFARSSFMVFSGEARKHNLA